MKTSTKIYATIMSLMSLLLMPGSVLQTAATGFIDKHPSISVAVAGFSGLWALLHQPKAEAPTQ